MNKKKLPFVIPMMIVFLNSTCQTITQESIKQETKIEFEIFSEVSSEINGCACFFSKNEKDYDTKKYIFVNDFAKYAFIKINGKQEKFERIDNYEGENKNTYYVYKKDEFVLRIVVTKKIPEGEESSKLFGLMTLTNSKGQKTELEFFGTCGC